MEAKVRCILVSKHRKRQKGNSQQKVDAVTPQQQKLNKAWKIFSSVGFAVLILYVIFCKTLVVRGESMYPTYNDKDILIGLRVFNTSTLLDKDYPVCAVKLPDGMYVIKRLIGKPGDKVALVDGDTYVNGRLVMERTTRSWDNLVFTCGEDQWLFLGDNREASSDGRFWPGNFVSGSAIKFYVPGSELEIDSNDIY